jgi:hypothetical protein
LPFTHRIDAFAQNLKRFKPREHPVGSRPKRFNDHSTLGGLDQNNDANMGMTISHMPKYLKPGAAPIF